MFRPILFVDFQDLGEIRLDAGTGQLRSWHFYGAKGAGEWPSHPISTEQLQDLVRRYGEEGGHPSLRIVSTQEQRGESPPSILVTVLPTHRSVPYAAQPSGHLEIEPQTGVLLEMVIYPAPTPPADVTPAVSASHARGVALAHLFSRSRPQPPRALYSVTPPARVEETLSMALYIWKPTPPGAGPEVYTTPEMGAMAERDEGMLAWSASWADLDSYDEGLGTMIRRYRAWIDAKTGRLLSFEQYYPFGGGGRAAEPRVAFAWDVPHSTVEVAVGAKAASVEQATIDALGPKELPGDAAPLVVRIGRMAVNARFSPSSGLFYAPVPKGWAAGRPSPNLRSAAEEMLR